MPNSELQQYIIRTLLYYEMFDHPLTADEIFLLLPKNSLSKDTLLQALDSMKTDGTILEHQRFYNLSSHGSQFAEMRLEREQLAKKRMKTAMFMSKIIRRFPFVRGVFVSGDLSKGVALPDSDIDYLIITEPQRLWICRSMLVLFKKIFLLNSKKYFCLNYFISANNLKLPEQNYYTATEIAHLKPLYNFDLFQKYIEANSWIKQYFPNYTIFAEDPERGKQSRSLIQSVLELFFSGTWASAFDRYLMNKMRSIWKRRYAQYDDPVLDQIFRTTPDESRAYGGNFEQKILDKYQQQLNRHNLA